MRASSRAIARLTPEGVKPRTSAALAKLPPSTTAASTLTLERTRPSRAMATRDLVSRMICHEVALLNDAAFLASPPFWDPREDAASRAHEGNVLMFAITGVAAISLVALEASSHSTH